MDIEELEIRLAAHRAAMVALLLELNGRFVDLRASFIQKLLDFEEAGRQVNESDAWISELRSLRKDLVGYERAERDFAAKTQSRQQRPPKKK